MPPATRLHLDRQNTRARRGGLVAGGSLALVWALGLLAGCGEQKVGAARLGDELGCTRCHTPTVKFVGPGFGQIAERYRGDPLAREALSLKIRQGSVGTWGRVIMPRQGHVTPAQARELAEWILAQPQGAAPP